MSSPAGTQIFRILLVEDNPADVYLLRQALKSAGLQVDLTVIQDGAEAVACIQREGKYAGRPAPDLAVLDLNLPKRSGTEVLEAMRRSKELSNVPVAIMSSSAAPSEQTKTKQLGVTCYITKPAELEKFLQIGEVLKHILLESTCPQAA